MGTKNFASDSLNEVGELLMQYYNNEQPEEEIFKSSKLRLSKVDESVPIYQIISALGLCHNVTPIIADDGSLEYQASSPDEVALVKFTESVNMTLIKRTREQIVLRN